MLKALPAAHRPIRDQSPWVQLSYRHEGHDQELADQVHGKRASARISLEEVRDYIRVKNASHRPRSGRMVLSPP